MAIQSHSGRSSAADGASAETHIPPWASKWHALPGSPPEVDASPPAPRAAEATQAAAAPIDEKPVPSAPPVPSGARGVLASRLLAGISAVSFILLAGLIVICWSDFSRALG